VAAVLVREFSEALLTAVLPPNLDALTGALDALVQAELLFRRGSPSNQLRLQARAGAGRHLRNLTLDLQKATACADRRRT
jgi:hypothetical protein